MAELDNLAAERPLDGDHFRWLAPSTLWLLLSIAVGVLGRFWGLNWDEGSLLHPDERFVSGLLMNLGWPSPQTWFDSAHSKFNPDNLSGIHYVYGQLPLLLGKLMLLASHSDSDHGFLPYGRFMAGLCDASTVVATYFTGRKIWGRRGGLIAAALLANAALHIQASHFFTMDSFAACGLAWGWWFGLLWLESGRARHAAVLGLCLGLAMACKISSVFALAGLLGLVWMQFRRRGPGASEGGGSIALAMAMLAFRFFNPMAFRGEGIAGFVDLRPEPRFLEDMRTQAAITAGRANVPFDVQWIGRTPWLYPLHNLAAWGYGWPFFALALAGSVWFVLRRRRSFQPGEMLLGALLFFGVMLLLVQGAQFSKFTRYYLPLTGTAALMATWCALRLETRSASWRAVTYLAVTATTAWGLCITSIYGHEHTRLAATRWIWAHLPRGSVVCYESSWDEALPIAWLPGPDGQGYDPHILKLDLAMFEDDDLNKRTQLLRKLDSSEWFFISSQRVWASIPRWDKRWPICNSFYTNLFSGNLGFRLEKEFTNPPGLGPFHFDDEALEEALTVYDHPRVLLYHKTSAWSYERAAALLAYPGEPALSLEPRLAHLTPGSLPTPGPLEASPRNGP